VRQKRQTTGYKQTLEAADQAELDRQIKLAMHGHLSGLRMPRGECSARGQSRAGDRRPGSMFATSPVSEAICMHDRYPIAGVVVRPRFRGGHRTPCRIVVPNGFSRRDSHR
jgi:hypothetical protein